jgi:HlyD family secretion protein
VSPAVADAPSVSDWRGPARLGYAVIFLTFVVGGTWAAFAKINSAVVAPAFVAIETNSKVIQHLEGGIIGEILVQENQYVEQDQVVLRLSDVQPKATMTSVQNQLLAAIVQEARLIAERDEKPRIEFPAEIRERIKDPVVANVASDQLATFQDRQRSLYGQISVLQARIQGLETEIRGLAIEEDSTRRQVAYVERELVGLHQLLSRHLVPMPRVLEMERERTRLEGVIGRQIADQAKARNAIGETRLNIEELRHKFQEETAAGILEIRQKIADLREKLSVSGDIMHRVDIRAPVSGHVQDLKVHGVGQVIRPGEALMEVVPDEEKLVIHANFAPNDIDRIHRASKIEVRFPAFHARTTPVIVGELASVSADRLTDETTHQPYYLGLVSVNKLDIPEDLRGRLRAGMPAEVIAPLADRSVLSYLISPLREAWHKSLREE